MFASYEPISSTTLSSTAGTFAFSGIPSTYTDLVCVARFAFDSSGQPMINQINSGTPTTSSTLAIGNGSATSSPRQSAAPSSIYFANGDTGWATQATLIIHFMNYSNNTTGKTLLWRYSNANQNIVVGSSFINTTAAINQFQFRAYITASFVAGSTFSLYGIKAK